MRLRDIGIISNSSLIYMFQSVARSWRSNEPEGLEPLYSALLLFKADATVRLPRKDLNQWIERYQSLLNR